VISQSDESGAGLHGFDERELGVLFPCGYLERSGIAWAFEGTNTEWIACGCISVFYMHSPYDTLVLILSVPSLTSISSVPILCLCFDIPRI
jgi:hypothetical protein